MIFGDCIFYSVTKMKADFIPTITRRLGRLTFAMKKRPTSGDVTYIWTLHGNVNVIASSFKDVTVFVVFNIFVLYSNCKLEINSTLQIFWTTDPPQTLGQIFLKFLNLVNKIINLNIYWVFSANTTFNCIELHCLKGKIYSLIKNNNVLNFGLHLIDFKKKLS